MNPDSVPQIRVPCQHDFLSALCNSKGRIAFVDHWSDNMLGYFVPIGMTSDSPVPEQTFRFEPEHRNVYGGLEQPTEFLNEDGSQVLGWFIPEREEDEEARYDAFLKRFETQMQNSPAKHGAGRKLGEILSRLRDAHA